MNGRLSEKWKARYDLRRMATEEDYESLKEAIEEYKKLFDSLKQDFALLVRRCPSAQTEINSWANCIGNPSYDQEEAKRCLAFAEKYGIRNP
jgi:hypothetical protein